MIRRRAMLRCAAMGLTLGPSLAWCYGLPHENAVPGGVKIIRLDVRGSAMPYVDADGHRALVVQDGANWVAVIGIPLSAPLATRQVVVHSNQGRQEISFIVGEKRYASQSSRWRRGK